MSITIHLGVIDVPYADGGHIAQKARTKAVKGGKTKFAKGNADITTGDVAEILEHQYGIMESFVDLNRPAVMAALEESLQDSLEAQLSGAEPDHDMFGPATSFIESQFKKELSEQFLDGLPGVPTKAAQDGVSHRFKHPYAKRPARPSFVDTGLYRASFKAWVD